MNPFYNIVTKEQDQDDAKISKSALQKSSTFIGSDTECSHNGHYNNQPY